jgi:hypothetical protein
MPAHISPLPAARPDHQAGPDPADALLDCAGAVGGEHAVILGCVSAEIMCGLLRRGAAAVTQLRRGERPEGQAADLVIVPEAGSAEAAAIAVGHARRALAPCGRVVLRIGADATGQLTLGVTRLLRLQGFSAIRQRRDGPGVLVSAELPIFGPLVRG